MVKDIIGLEVGFFGILVEVIIKWNIMFVLDKYWGR